MAESRNLLIGTERAYVLFDKSTGNVVRHTVPAGMYWCEEDLGQAEKFATQGDARRFRAANKSFLSGTSIGLLCRVHVPGQRGVSDKPVWVLCELPQAPDETKEEKAPEELLKPFTLQQWQEQRIWLVRNRFTHAVYKVANDIATGVLLEEVRLLTSSCGETKWVPVPNVSSTWVSFEKLLRDYQTLSGRPLGMPASPPVPTPAPVEPEADTGYPNSLFTDRGVFEVFDKVSWEPWRGAWVRHTATGKAYPTGTWDDKGVHVMGFFDGSSLLVSWPYLLHHFTFAGNRGTAVGRPVDLEHNLES